jgi:protein-disulfide isomerase
MRFNLPTLAATAILGLLGAATMAGAAPQTTDSSNSSGSFWSRILPNWNSSEPKAERPAKAKHAAKNARRAGAKKPTPAAQPDEAAIGQAVRDFLTNNKDVLRGAIVEVLRNDPEVQKLVPAAPEKSEKAEGPISTPAPANAEQARIEEIVRNYLLVHPEVLQEAIAELEKRQALAEAEKHKAAVVANAELLYNSPRQVVLGNPQGDVTFVEFFDYNCAYCKRAMADMMDLLKTDSKLKVVLKEFPVLGQGSVEAAQVATAVRMQDKTGKKYLEFHQKLLGGRGQADRTRALAVAKDIGLDMARLEKDMASDEARAALEESLRIAEAIGLNGTPSYVVGPNVVIGAVGLNALREKVNTARCGKTTC